MYSYIKRFFDFIASFIGLIFCSPILVVVSILIYLDDPGPIIFKQKRIGLNNKNFTIYKFRSMKVNTPDLATHLLDNSKTYITKVGKIIRATSIDELPQLWNIVKGDMSVVGPRPALHNQHELIEKRNRVEIFSIRPGITGLAQVSGRDMITIDQKVYFDKKYLDNMGLILDIKIIFKTFITVVFKKGYKKDEI